MKTARVYGVQIICFCFLLLAAAYFFPVGSTGNTGQSGECEPYRSGWQVTIEDGVQGMNWKQDAQLPEYIAMRGVSQIILERTVEEPDTIGFFTFQQQVHVFLDGEEIQHFAPERQQYSRTPGNGWQFVELTGEDVGSTLSIRIIQCYGSGRVMVPVFYHGTKDGIILHYLAHKIPMFLVSMLGVMVGLVLLLIWGVLGQKIRLSKGLPWLALFAIFIGTWSVIEANMYSFFFKNLLLISRLSYMCLKMAVAPFILFVNITFHNRESKLLRILTVLSVVEFWVTGFLQLFGILDYADTVFVTHAILMISSVYIIVTAIPKLLLHRTEWKKATDQRIADFHVDGDNAPDITIAIAAGYAAFDSSVDSDLKKTMKRADVRMYERKKQLKAQKSAQN